MEFEIDFYVYIQYTLSKTVNSFQECKELLLEYLNK